MGTNNRQRAINDFIQNDPFAEYLGATVEIIAPGHSRVTLTVTEEMANFHGMTHGGLIFTLGDLAFAAASNSHGQTAVALNVSISFLRASKPGDQLVAEAKEQHAGGPIALYEINVSDIQTGEVIAKSQDMVYRKREWFVQKE
ncbi:MAG: hotdog fold thioesterase [Deltaproteobacteria bacterium]|nr:hotdog fold thioesterase [Deltaproteobacteria bacterium]